MNKLLNDIESETSLAELKNWQYGNKKINKVYTLSLIHI